MAVLILKYGDASSHKVLPCTTEFAKILQTVSKEQNTKRMGPWGRPCKPIQDESGAKKYQNLKEVKKGGKEKATSQ